MDEKQKNQEKAFMSEEEYLTKMQNEKEEREEALEWLQVDVQNNEIQQKARISTLEQESLFNIQKISTLERCLEETKSNLN